MKTNPTRKDATLTFRLPEQLKAKAERKAERQKFRSTGDYVTSLIEQDLDLQRKTA